MAAKLHMLEAPTTVTSGALPTTVSLPELLSAFSLALDLSEGRPLRHAQRTTLIALHLAERLGLQDGVQTQLWLAGLLHDAGMSRIGHLLASLCRVPETELISIHAIASPEQMARLTVGGKIEKVFELMAAHNQHGAAVVRELDLPEGVGLAVLHHHERWDGLGLPGGLCGEDIPIEARVLALAEVVECTSAAAGQLGDGKRAAAHAALNNRARSQLDPQLCAAGGELLDDRETWQQLMEADPAQLIGALPGSWHPLPWAELDSIAKCFAVIVDTKSPFTEHHSLKVAKYSTAVGQILGLGSVDLALLNLAGLLHDLGKLGLSNRILDKQGPLTDQEFAEVKEHPVHTDTVLAQLPQFGDVRLWAGSHHERLDGTGYPRGLKADQLPLPARILNVCDVYEALTSHRPYRMALPAYEAIATLEAEQRERYDIKVIDALRKCAFTRQR